MVIQIHGSPWNANGATSSGILPAHQYGLQNTELTRHLEPLPCPHPAQRRQHPLHRRCPHRPGRRLLVLLKESNTRVLEKPAPTKYSLHNGILTPSI